MANRAPRNPRRRSRWRLVRKGLAGVVVLIMAGSCAAPVVPPPAPAPRVPVARPAPARLPASREGWQDMPIAPGEWRWSREGGGSVARFGAGGQTVALISCNDGTIAITRYGAIETTQPTPTVVIRTSSDSRPNAGANRSDGVTLALAARDPMLDAIAFSRGRFALEVQGMAPLALPSWPEVARVIDDCRG